MKLTIKEKADSHGSQVTHILDFKEGLNEIKFSALDRIVEISFTTRRDPYVFKIGEREQLDSICIDNYSV